MERAWVVRCVRGFSFAMVLMCAGHVLAEDVVHLKGGGLVHGDLMELMPNEYVSIRLLDGTSRRIEWAQVERVDQDTPPPASSTNAASTTPSTTPAATPTEVIVTGVPSQNVQPAPATMTPTIDDPARAARRQQLQTEITAIQDDQRQLSLTSYGIMMYTGYLGLGLFLPASIALIVAGSFCDGCGAMVPAGLVVGGLSAATIVIGVMGVVGYNDTKDRRSENARQLFVREQELKTLSYDVSIGPMHANAMLTLRF